ncbi:TetR family transcriptional regulator [Nocardioides albertanoniae]|uniref:TetR family transcriptional regulator n=1 Tax=Nocardioides albertanoniae TaxID=1175486 RepID=A0A543A7V4_9ACTN|nr:GntR family transcriptional regulator [Nocardioides albertanoniae]TQL68681.1 TetR family transcriptional regulator [Nocardioides albertanoniae]
MTSQPRPEAPYRVIVAEIRSRIEAGELRAGERVPSIRAIAQRWGVAVATATKVIATLREEGLVEARVGSGTVVSSPDTRPAARSAHRDASAAPRDGAGEQDAVRTRILRAAIDLADTEGLQALSMRRLASSLDLGPMSLYRHVSGKDDLLAQMADLAFGDLDLPERGPRGWRAKLELVARQHWRLCRRHQWLPHVVSFTRPVMVPNMLEHTEWVLRALEELDLPMDVRLQEAMTLHGLVMTIGLSRTREAEAERRTGMTLDRWSAHQRPRHRDVLARERFPLLATMSEDPAPELDALFEYGLARHLDGFAVMTGS